MNEPFDASSPAEQCPDPEAERQKFTARNLAELRSLREHIVCIHQAMTGKEIDWATFDVDEICGEIYWTACEWKQELRTHT